MKIDHDSIDVSAVIERYLRGELAAEEEKDWEEHYFHCTECFQILEETAGVAQFFRNEAPKRPEWYEITEPRVGLVRSLSSAFKHAPPWQTLLAAAMLLIVVGVPALLGWMTVSSLERERSLVQSPALMERSYFLQEGQRGEIPAVVIPKDAGQFLLQFNLLALDEEPTIHRAEIVDAAGKTVWADGKLKGHGRYGTFVLSCHSSFFEPGDYRLHVEEIRGIDGVVVNSFDFLFRVAVSSDSEGRP